MARGTLGGLILGTALAICGAAVLSVINPPRPAPQVVSTDPTATSPAETATDTVQAQPIEGQATAAQPESPQAPRSESAASLTASDTAPASVPTVGQVASLPPTGTVEEAAPQISLDVDAPRVAGGGTSAPAAPELAQNASISTEPAQPAPPAIEQSSAFDTAAEGETPTAEEQADQAQDAPLSSPEMADDQASDTGGDAGTQVAEGPAEAETPNADPEPDPPTTADTPVAEAPAPVETAEPPSSSTEEVASARAETEGSAERTEPRIAVLPRVNAGMTETSRDEDVAEESAGPAAPRATLGRQAQSLTDRDDQSSSLPTLGQAQSAASGASDPATDADLPPIQRFASPFENTEAKPLMSIVLIDDASSIGGEALATFPYPLSFAISPEDPQAAEKMARHRAAGFEVLALMDVPEGASAQDVEVALGAGLGVITDAVGVLEGIGDGLQGSRAVSDQVTSYLLAEGYGLVMQNEGLNTAQKLAERAGVPSAFVFRDFDGAEQTPTVMRRFLDQAAFRARQEGGVVMLGRVRPDTISALLLWGLQDRATRVALSPVSAVLTLPPE